MIKITYGECKRVYEAYFGKKMPDDLPYSYAAQKVLNEVGARKFRELLAKVRKVVNNPSGEYFVDYDEKTGLWCVFHTDKKTGFAHATLCSKEEAEGIAEIMNKKHNNPAKTVAQQKLFAIALGIKKGQIARSYSAEAAKMADRMSVRKLEEFARTRFNPLQQNILPEIAALAMTGFGIGLGYKSAGALWNKVSKKNPVGFQGRCAKCGSILIKVHELKTANYEKFDRYMEYTCKECKHFGVFYFKVVRQTNPGEAYHVDRAAMFEGFARNSGVKALSRRSKAIAESERHNAKMSKDLGMTNPVSHKVHPKAFEMRDMYKGDVKAGHTEAADYWRGGAAALFTDGNPVVCARVCRRCKEFYIPRYEKDSLCRKCMKKFQANGKHRRK